MKTDQPFKCISCERWYKPEDQSKYHDVMCVGCGDDQLIDEKLTCPSCGGYIPNNQTPGAYPGAVSRKDNKTMICSECGTREALEDLLPKDDVNTLIQLMKEVTFNTDKYVYVDVDSGTILNGPIYAVPSVYITGEETDDEVRFVATRWGKNVELPF